MQGITLHLACSDIFMAEILPRYDPLLVGLRVDFAPDVRQQQQATIDLGNDCYAVVVADDVI
jgi:hypothetical protein